jgi:hypothetical protein
LRAAALASLAGAPAAVAGRAVHAAQAWT